LSIAISLLDTFNVLGKLFFSGLLIFAILRLKSTSVHFIAQASPSLAPVSFKSCRKVDVFFPLAAVRASSSFSVGINGSLLTAL